MAPLMPKATAVWLVENTTLTFDQIAEFCGLHSLEIQGVADGEVAVGIRGMDPIIMGQISRDEISRCENDSKAKLQLIAPAAEVPKRSKRARYTPVSKRQERPNGIAWLLKNYPELSDSQIGKLLGTTKTTITAVRDRTHWNSQHISAQDPVLMGICGEVELVDAVNYSRRRQARANARKKGSSSKPEKILEVASTIAIGNKPVELIVKNEKENTDDTNSGATETKSAETKSAETKATLENLAEKVFGNKSNGTDT